MRIPFDPPKPPSLDTEGDSLISLAAERRRRGLPDLELPPCDADAAILEMKGTSSYGYCRHAHIMCNADDRTVACVDCGDEVDPFRALMQYAHNERNFQYRSELLRREQQKLEDEIEELKRIKSNLRASVRRAGGDPDERDPIAQRRTAIARGARKVAKVLGEP